MGPLGGLGRCRYQLSVVPQPTSVRVCNRVCPMTPFTSLTRTPSGQLNPHAHYTVQAGDYSAPHASMHDNVNPTRPVSYQFFSNAVIMTPARLSCDGLLASQPHAPADM